jgi:hypothetical protein
MSDTIATDKIRKERYDKCKSCENFLKLIRVCKLCGCFMPAKTALSSATCPDDPPRWK